MRNRARDTMAYRIVDRFPARVKITFVGYLKYFVMPQDDVGVS
jgi:hypothetical protein